MLVLSVKKHIQPLIHILAPFWVYIIFTLFLFSFSRLMLVVWLFPRVMATDGLAYIMFQGLRFDLVILGITLVMPLLVAPFMHTNMVLTRVWKPLLVTYLLICFSVFVFIEASTPSFINQYDLRPNIWFIEYLKYPNEVLSTLYKAYKLQLVIAVSVTLSSVFYLYVRLNKSTRNTLQIKWPVAVLVTPLIFLWCVAAVRSTLDHRAVNPSTVAFSSDPLINSLALSSSYTVLYAAYQMMEEQQNLRPYGDIDDSSVIREVRKNMYLPSDLFVNNDIPTLHIHKPQTKLNKPKNLVIILMESLGAEFVGKLGGLPLTPNIDRLSNEGIWFENLYATGTRSVRGIEAVISGFLPTTARSVVKQPKSQNGFFTIASALKSQGYSTSFIYGGEGQFDNMASFFSGNGFDKIIDQDDYVNPVSYGSWGVPDEELFKKAEQELSQQHKNGPFFSLLFTASNHSPYDFPDGRIDLFEEPKSTKNNAAKYTDFTVGEFIKSAKKSAYWEDTVFLIIADHNSRVYGSSLVPINGFHIPALILGKGIEAKSISRVSSQIDMLPTLLSLIGVEAEIPATGIDMTRKDIESIPGRAIMQYSANQAYMEDDKVVILTPNQKPKHYSYVKQRLIPLTKIDKSLEIKALAHSIWPTEAYQKRLYKTQNVNPIVNK